LKPVELLKVMTSGFFNVKTIHKKPILPADFLIDENQIVYRVYYGRDYGDHVPIADVLAWKNNHV
jgi:thioredoxin-dependent peroxiredoxin